MARSKFVGNSGVVIDGQKFTNVDILDNELIYYGGPLPTFVNCTLQNNYFALQGPAENTLNFLRMMVQMAPPSERDAMLIGIGLHPSSFNDDDEAPDGQ